MYIITMETNNADKHYNLYYPLANKVAKGYSNTTVLP